MANQLVALVIIGINTLSQHSAVTIDFKGKPMLFCMSISSLKCTAYKLLSGIKTSKLKLITTSICKPTDAEHEIDMLLSGT